MLRVITEKYNSDLLNVELELYKDDDNNYWFHGATLCNIFELLNPSQTIQRHVDDDWRRKFPVTHGKEAWFVMEPGLYQLLHISKHPAAKRFQRWVYGDVLPKLRSQGLYVVKNRDESLAEYEEREAALLAENHRLIEAKAMLQNQIHFIFEDVTYTDRKSCQTSILNDIFCKTVGVYLCGGERRKVYQHAFEYGKKSKFHDVTFIGLLNSLKKCYPEKFEKIKPIYKEMVS
jgi:prophage antirepressor-like protein